MEPVYVEDAAERKGSYPERAARLPVWEMPGDSREAWRVWAEKHRWRINYQVHWRNNEEAQMLRQKLWDMGPAPDLEEEMGIIARLKEIESPRWEEKTELQRWKHMSEQMPGDWGPVSPENKDKFRQIMTALASGRVLEAMCGFTSYFDDSPRITEVIALDFCRESLERYSHPERKRILFDLENICSGGKFDFFGDGSFDTIGVFFGIRYLTKIFPVFEEFRRILSPGGKLLVVENPHQGYEEMLKHRFEQEQFAYEIGDAGFNVRLQELPEIKLSDTRYCFNELGDYWLIEGTKNV